MKEKFTCIAAAAALTAGVLLGGTVRAAAYTADDVAAKARASGWPDYLIQAGYNEWSSGNYTQAQLDQAYASVAQYNEQTGEMICAAMGVPYTASTPAATEAPQDTAAPDAATQNAAVPDAATQDAASPETVQTGEASISVAATVTKTDGTTEERIPKSDFINMSLEEKQNYVASLTEESRITFMETLTTEERNSIIKQLPVEDKAALVQTYVDTASDMGMNVAVDSIEGSDVSLTIRNDEGQIIGKAAVGSIVDETGIDHTVPLLTALGTALLAAVGFGVLSRKNHIS